MNFSFFRYFILKHRLTPLPPLGVQCLVCGNIVWCLGEVGFKVKERCTVCHALRIVFMLVKGLLWKLTIGPDIRIYVFSVTCFPGFSMNLLELAASVVQGASLLFYGFMMFGHVA
jgi:hypothetical protein